MLQFGLRIGKRPRQVITTTPKPIKLLRALVKRGGQDVVVTRGRTDDNAANLAASFFSQIVSRYEGTRLGRQELDAELLEDMPGALWTRDLIEEGRRTKADIPPMRRIVVAIDPAISIGEESDETGIIVAGLGTDAHGYVLEDASGKFAPIEWARRAVGALSQVERGPDRRRGQPGRRHGPDDRPDGRPERVVQGRPCEPQQDHAGRAGLGAE